MTSSSSPSSVSRGGEEEAAAAAEDEATALLVVLGTGGVVRIRALATWLLLLIALVVISGQQASLSATKQTTNASVLQFKETPRTVHHSSLSAAALDPNFLDKNDENSDATSQQEQPVYTTNLAPGSVPIPYEQVVRMDPAFRVSPFELRWRGWMLPPWARKQPFKGQETVPRGKHICYVHVGKTAGSTVGCALGFSLHCYDGTTSTFRLPGILPMYTTNMLHNDVNDCADQMPNYLFVVRNPIHRIESAYVYDRTLEEGLEHLKALYEDCPFWTLNDFVDNGLDFYGKASEECKIRAFHTIRGQEMHGNHLFYNYQYYLNLSQAKAAAQQILVIRQEHMVDDWNSAEVIVGSDHPLGPTRVSARDFPHKNSGNKAPADQVPLARNSRLMLCESLCQEIQTYKSILRLAVNLSQQDVEESLKELYKSCPRQAYDDTCALQ